MLSHLFSTLPMKIAGGIVAALMLALIVVMARADSISNERDRLRDAVAEANARHAITRASLTQMQDEMAAIIHAGALREERVAEALAEQQKRSQVLRDEADRILRETPSVRCETPRSILQSNNL